MATLKKPYTKEFTPAEYSPEELLFREKLKEMCELARIQREQPFDEFDGQTYEQYYESNKKAANAYIAPKINEGDVRVSGGITKEKKKTLLSALLNYNYQPSVLAFNEHEIEDSEIGSMCSDLIKKSRQLEEPRYEEKRPLLYSELLDQGTAHVWEKWYEYKIPDNEYKDFEMAGVKVKGMEIIEKLAETFKRCEIQSIPGINVFPGNVKEFYIQRQPYMVIRNPESWAVLEAKYGGWERWKNVPTTFDPVIMRDNQIAYDKWQMLTTKDRTLGEELIIMNKWENWFMVMVNGTMMLPIKFPLKYLIGITEYPTTKGDIGPISEHFYWSKSSPADTKIDDQLFSETLKLMYLKTRRSFKPPYINNTGQELTDKIFDAGMMTPNVQEKGLVRLLPDDQGVTPSEYNFFSLMKSIMDNKTMSPVMEGQALDKAASAREVVEVKQQGMAKIGLPILGVMNMENRMSWLRLQNIVSHWTDPIDQKVKEIINGVPQIDKKYRTVSVETTLENGRSGNRVVKFTKERIPGTPDEQAQIIKNREDLVYKKTGKIQRRVYIDPDWWKAAKYNYYIESTPVPRDSTELQAAMFSEKIGQGYNLFGPQSFNQDYLKQRWSTVQREDYERLFVQPEQQPAQPGMPPMQPGQQAPQGQPMGAPAIPGGQGGGGNGRITGQMSPQRMNLRDLVGR